MQTGSNRSISQEQSKLHVLFDELSPFLQRIYNNSTQLNTRYDQTFCIEITLAYVGISLRASLCNIIVGLQFLLSLCRKRKFVGNFMKE